MMKPDRIDAEAHKLVKNPLPGGMYRIGIGISGLEILQAQSPGIEGILGD